MKKPVLVRVTAEQFFWIDEDRAQKLATEGQRQLQHEFQYLSPIRLEIVKPQTYMGEFDTSGKERGEAVVVPVTINQYDKIKHVTVERSIPKQETVITINKVQSEL